MKILKYKPINRRQNNNSPTNNTPYEDFDQTRIASYLEEKKLKFTSIPNSTYTKSRWQKRKNTETGLRPGLPDLLIIIKNKLIFIEMKREKGGVVSDSQKAWIEALNDISVDIKAHVAKGFEEAKKIIDYYIEI